MGPHGTGEVAPPNSKWLNRSGQSRLLIRRSCDTTFRTEKCVVNPPVERKRPVVELCDELHCLETVRASWIPRVLNPSWMSTNLGCCQLHRPDCYLDRRSRPQLNGYSMPWTEYRVWYDVGQPLRRRIALVLLCDSIGINSCRDMARETGTEFTSQNRQDISGTL